MRARLGNLGSIALSVLLPGVEAKACTDSWVETRYYCSPGAQDWRCKQTRTCRQCVSGKVCSSWSAPSCFTDASHC